MALNLGPRLITRLFNSLAKYNDEHLARSLYDDNRKQSRQAYKNCRTETRLAINEQKGVDTVTGDRLLAELLDFMAEYGETALLRRLYHSDVIMTERAEKICKSNTMEVIKCKNIQHEDCAK